MEIKEAIEFVRYIFSIADINYDSKKRDKVIELLQRGEKYEAMWENDLKNRMRNFTSSAWETLVNAINDIEQKYSPKSFKKTITFTVEAPTEHHLGTAINDFEMFWADYNGGKGHCAKYSYAKEEKDED